MKEEAKPLFKIGIKDLAKSAIVAGLTVIVTGAISLLSGLTNVPPVYPTLPVLCNLALSGLVAGAVYLLKNLLTNSEDQFAKSEPK